LTGEELSLSKLTEAERGYLGELSGAAANGTDYFDLLRRVKGPKALPLRGGPITPAIAASVLYRAAHDIADRVGIKQGYLLEPEAVSSVHVGRVANPLSLTEAAALIGITRPAAHQAVTEGRLRGHRVGNAWIIARADAESYRRARSNRVADDQSEQRPVARVARGSRR
jgi:excisionase family DNA binding protein